MWKKIRLFVSILSLACFVLLFCDQSEQSFLAIHLAFLAKIQLVPALLAGAGGILIVLLGITFVYGRIYCSLVCPLGLLQDLILSVKKKRAFRYLREYKVLRYGILIAFCAGLVWGIPLLVDVFEPYSAAGRILANIGRPIAVLINNGFDWLFAGQTVFVAPKTFFAPEELALLCAAVVFLLLVLLCLAVGRLWCGAICPVGTFLGLISRFALFRPRIDKESCTHCGKCERVCKVNCIDSEASVVDASRCVGCLNCQGVCPARALTFMERENVRTDDRRSALAKVGAGIVAFLALPAVGHAAADEKSEAELLSRTYRARVPHSVPMLPAGAKDLGHFTSHCTGCQLCVANCPQHVLVPSDLTHGMFQPSLSFEHGFCSPACTICSQVCPTGAIGRVRENEKAVIQIGRASVDLNLCIVTKDKVTCTLCQRNCPSKAITLVGDGEHKHPQVDGNLCIGCGACEYYCPARPKAAIAVVGNKEHTFLTKKAAKG